MTFTFSTAYAYLSPRTAGGAKWSLHPTQALLDQLGCPDRHFRSVHIGGTNGKGSVAALVYAALRESGRGIALYTSPHLVDVRERMIVDDRPIPKAAFASWTTALREAIEHTGASFFESTTAIAFADFAARGAEIAVIEVGLGGRLDSTNVIQPLVSCVTQIRREHTDYLGESLDGIAREKAGIAKPGVPFVIGEKDPRLAEVLEEAAAATGAPIVLVPADKRYEGLLRLRGPHQRRNAAVAEAVLGALPDGVRPSRGAIARGFARANLPGRFEIRGKWVLDVAHNPSSVDALVSALLEARPPRPLHLLVGILADKDWKRMLHDLARVADALWITQPPTAPETRRWDLDVVRAAVPLALKVEPDFDRALDAVQHGAQTVLVTGSFHTVGDAMARLPGFAPLG